MAKRNEALITFRAETKEFTDGIKNVNKSLANLKSDLKLANAEIKANGESFGTLTNKSKTLKSAMEANATKVQLLEKKLDACKNSLGENSDEYNRLYKQLNTAKTAQANFRNELNKTDAKLEALGNEVDSTTKDFKEFDDATDGATSNSGGLKGALDKLKGGFGGGKTAAIALGTALGGILKEAILACINAIADFCKYLWDLPEATAEFRTNLAKLDASTKQYGYNTKDTNKQIKELYGYFADDQVCVNAITNLQGLKLSQSQLKSTTNACIAVWTAYGDSIPIESLTESVNETSQVGKVTGSLADALNWAGISEDKFNQKLAKCKTTQERAKLVTDTLNKAYGTSKKTFDENNKSVNNLNKSTYDLKTREAELGKTIEPLKTKFIDLKSKGLQAVIDTIPKLTKELQDLKKWFGDVATKCKETYDKSKALQYIFGLLKVATEAVKGKLKTLWSTLKLVWEVIQLVWEVCKPLLKIFGDIANKIGEKLLPKLKNLKTDSGTTAKSIDSFTSKVKKAKEWISKLGSHKWNIQKPTLPNVSSLVQNLIKTIKNKLKNPGIKWSIPKPKLPSVNVSSLISSIRRKLQNNGIRWSIPKPSLPTFRATLKWTTKTVLGKPFRYPSGISWNKNGGIFTSPTIFATPNAGLQGVGEAGAEAILPLDSFYKHLDNKIDSINTGNTIIINMQDFHIHDDLDVNTLAENLAFQVKRQMGFR